MTKLSTILGASVLALSLGGFAFAADEQPGQPAGDAQQQYQAALKKCESLPQTEQLKCIDAAKKKFGQM
jgi:hypothetical protein